MDRAAYDRYLAAFNAKDYAAIADFYIDPPMLRFFGVEIRSRHELKDFYGFLHAYITETITVLNYAASDTLAAVEAMVCVEAMRDLTAETLLAHGASGLMPMRSGDRIEMRQFIHYRLKGGRISSVECAMLEHR
ncbi:hypothetical protein DBR17_15335 [Sphingomonas sp. HMWF008]|nr:hypothetical protein DBR17_15335 [Sphingomonas sp. HMWF008]